jgi:hypothetical protein
MKAAIVILLGGGKSVQPGEEIPEGLDAETIASLKAAGAIEGEGAAVTVPEPEAAPEPEPEPPKVEEAPKVGPSKSAGGSS